MNIVNLLKKIEAIIRTSKFNDVKASLDTAAVKGLTVYQVQGLGNQRGQALTGGRPGSFRTTELIPKTKIEIVCRDEDADEIMHIIASSARTGKKGDGKIFISDVDNIFRIRSGDEGGGAL